jgi:hypothetical protein
MPPSRSQPIAVASHAASPPDPLPAGIYFRRLSSYTPCHHVDDGEARGLCTDPTHAVIASEIASTSLDARRVASRVATLPLSPGYPVVTHSDEVGIAGERRGIVFVLGLFANEAAATALRQRLGAGSEVVRLLDDEQAQARAERFAAGADHGPQATRLRSGAGVTVYRGVMQPPLDDDDGELELPPDGGEPDRHLPLQPLCTLPAGSPVLARPQRWSFGYYSWLPVTCDDGRPGWVRWSETMMHTTVTRVPGEDRFEIIRLVGAECDSPIFEIHAYTPERGPGRLIAGNVGGGPC